MARMTRISRWLPLALMLAGAFGTAASANGEPPDELPAIPPGQETLLLEMLGKGAALPDGCKLAEGKVEYTVVEAKYQCRSGSVVLEIAHSSEAFDSDTQTGRFAISVMEGSPLPDLVDELSARIVKREADFEWVIPADEPGEFD